MDRLLPSVPYRQWVLVVPKRLRYFINRSPELSGRLSKIFAREINRFLCRNNPGTPSQLQFIQRFGGSINLNPAVQDNSHWENQGTELCCRIPREAGRGPSAMRARPEEVYASRRAPAMRAESCNCNFQVNLHVHVHAVVSDGVFNLRPNATGKSELPFTPVSVPTEKELADIVTTIRKKLIRRVCRTSGLSPEAAANLLSWKNSGFSVHEEVYIRNWDREGLERLLGYCSRPAISVARLIYAAKSNRVIYRSEAKKGESELLTMTPIEFLRRWGLLMPPPNKNLIHYYGALAPRSPLRRALVAKAARETNKIILRERTDKLKKQAKSWAACLARVFEVFPLICPKCNLEMKPVAVILKDKELVRLLTHLGLPAEFPTFKPAPKVGQNCGPPDENCQLDPRADLCEAIDPAPADD